MCEKEIFTGFVWGGWGWGMKKSDHLQDIDVDGRAILNLY